ncbi:MAG: hypothetical protein AAF724_10000 [Pseudomonadota bacterium]
MANKRRYIVVAVAVLLTTGATQAAEWSCVRGPLQAEGDVAAQLHDATAEKVVEEAPHLGAIARIYADLSKSRKQIRRLRIEWLFSADPDRLFYRDALFSFAWSESDNAAWIESDGTNRQAAQQQQRLMDVFASHADRSAFMDFMKARVRTPPLVELYETSGMAISAERAKLDRCFE